MHFLRDNGISEFKNWFSCKNILKPPAGVWISQGKKNQRKKDERTTKACINRRWRMVELQVRYSETEREKGMHCRSHKEGVAACLGKNEAQKGSWGQEQRKGENGAQQPCEKLRGEQGLGDVRAVQATLADDRCPQKECCLMKGNHRSHIFAFCYHSHLKYHQGIFLSYIFVAWLSPLFTTTAKIYYNTWILVHRNKLSVTVFFVFFLSSVKPRMTGWPRSVVGYAMIRSHVTPAPWWCHHYSTCWCGTYHIAHWSPHLVFKGYIKYLQSKPLWIF